MSDAPQAPDDSKQDDTTAQPVTVTTEAVTTEAVTAAAETKKQKKPRSNVERAIVWGGIGVLLIVAGIQGFAAYGYARSQSKIAAALDAAEESSGGELSLSEAEKLMAGFWSKSEIQKKNADRFVVYTWSGVYQSYTVLLNISAESRVADEVEKNNPTVTGYELNTTTSHHTETIVAMSNKNVVEAADGDVDNSASGDGMAGMGDGGGSEGPANSTPEQREGGRPRIDWDELDKDGDGKVSKEEAPERMQQFFDRLDTNGDGFIDDAERQEMQRRREERQRNGGGGDRDSERSQPPTDDDKPPTASSPDEDEPDPPAKPE